MLRSSRAFTGAPSLGTYRSRLWHHHHHLHVPLDILQVLRRRLNILAIESSCDDSCVAILNLNLNPNLKPGSAEQPLARLLFNEKITSDNVRYGGIHPLRAMEGHHANIAKLVDLGLTQTGLAGLGSADGQKVDLVAVTRGPGMRNNLQAGIDVAKGLSVAWKVPMVGVHHMQAHALSARMQDALRVTANNATPRQTAQVEPRFPFLSLLVSGGHTLLVHSTSLTKHRVLAVTNDIAVGDCLDKIARLVLPPEVIETSDDVSYGKLLETFAFGELRPGAQPLDYKYSPSKTRQPQARKASAPNEYGWFVPVPFSRSGTSVKEDSRFSFSGMVAHVARIVKYQDYKIIPRSTPMSVDEARALAIVVMEAVFEHLAHRVLLHLEKLHSTPHLGQQDIPDLVLAGGVAANRFLRHVVRQYLYAHREEHLVPTIRHVSPIYCTDNAAMIAWAAAEMVGAVGIENEDFKLEFGDYKENLGMRSLRKWNLERLMTPAVEEEIDAYHEKRRDERQNVTKKENVLVGTAEGADLDAAHPEEVQEAQKIGQGDDETVPGLDTDEGNKAEKSRSSFEAFISETMSDGDELGGTRLDHTAQQMGLGPTSADRKIVALEGINAALKGMTAVLADFDKLANNFKSIARALDPGDLPKPVDQGTTRGPIPAPNLERRPVSSLLSALQQWRHGPLFDLEGLSSKSTADLMILLSMTREERKLTKLELQHLRESHKRELTTLDLNRGTLDTKHRLVVTYRTNLRRIEQILCVHGKNHAVLAHVINERKATVRASVGKSPPTSVESAIHGNLGTGTQPVVYDKTTIAINAPPQETTRNVTTNMSNLAKGEPPSSSAELENVLAMLQKQQTVVQPPPEATITELSSVEPTSRLPRLNPTQGKPPPRVSDGVLIPRRLRGRSFRLVNPPPTSLGLGRGPGYRAVDLPRSIRPRYPVHINRGGLIRRPLALRIRARANGIVRDGGQIKQLQLAKPETVEDAAGLRVILRNEVQIGSINEI